MSTAVIAGILLILLAVIIGVVIAIRRRPQETGSSIEDRLAEYSERDTPVTLEELELSASFSERIIYPAVDALSRFIAQLTPAQTLEKTRHTLELAENPGDLSAANFFAIRFVVMILLGGLLYGLMTVADLPAGRKLLFTLISAVLGFFLPALWLRSKIQRRQAEIIKQLPDTLDLLTICVEAGLGFDQSIQRVVDKSDHELSRALNRYLQETGLGRTRRDALLSMSDRIEVPDVTTFVAAIVQADALGVSMAKVLRIQSEQMRVRRRQRAEQKAHQAPIKMLFPLAFLIFPSIFIVLLGPAVLMLIDSGVLGTVL
jgi:tight adherence protein C